MKYLITGATGQFGSHAVTFLLNKVPAGDIVVSVRDLSKAAPLKDLGIEVRQGDFDQPQSLKAAFKDIDRLLIISTDGDNETRIRQHKNAVTAAKEAGVSFIAYTSLANAADSSLSLAPVHKATEAAILETGIPYAFLRNNWYLENEASSIQGAAAGYPWTTSAGQGRIGSALRKDYAEAAINALIDLETENITYELSGPLVTQEDLAKITGQVLGREVLFNQVSDEAYRAVLAGAGLPDFVCDFLTLLQKDIRHGGLEVVDSDFEKLLGRPLTPLSQGIQSILGV